MKLLKITNLPIATNYDVNTFKEANTVNQDNIGFLCNISACLHQMIITDSISLYLARFKVRKESEMSYWCK